MKKDFTIFSDFFGTLTFELWHSLYFHLNFGLCHLTL
jgi:hypothetical protein